MYEGIESYTRVLRCMAANRYFAIYQCATQEINKTFYSQSVLFRMQYTKIQITTWIVSEIEMG